MLRSHYQSPLLSCTFQTGRPHTAIVWMQRVLQTISSEEVFQMKGQQRYSCSEETLPSWKQLSGNQTENFEASAVRTQHGNTNATSSGFTLCDTRILEICIKSCIVTWCTRTFEESYMRLSATLLRIRYGLRWQTGGTFGNLKCYSFHCDLEWRQPMQEKYQKMPLENRLAKWTGGGGVSPFSTWCKNAVTCDIFLSAPVRAWCLYLQVLQVLKRVCISDLQLYLYPMMLKEILKPYKRFMGVSVVKIEGDRICCKPVWKCQSWGVLWWWTAWDEHYSGQKFSFFVD